MIKFNKKQEKIITHLIKQNGDQYNMLKTSEECQELSLVLMQKVLKKIKIPDQAVIDEIGDVIIRLEIIKKMYPEDLIQKRIDYKLSKFKEYQDHKLYKQI